MNFGFIYRFSYWGSPNEDNTTGWGIIYPILAGGSLLLASITKILVDTGLYKADATKI